MSGTSDVDQTFFMLKKKIRGVARVLQRGGGVTLCKTEAIHQIVMSLSTLCFTQCKIFRMNSETKQISKSAGFSTKLLRLRYRHGVLTTGMLLLFVCLKKRPTKGGDGYPTTPPPSYALENDNECNR